MSTGTGKLIYQLTSASALKDNDLFVISSAENNLTRSITLSQIREAVIGDRYTNEDILEFVDDLKLQIKNMDDLFYEYDNNLSEFRNEFNAQLLNLRTNFTNDLNEVQNNITNRIDNLQDNINNYLNTIEQDVSDLNTRIDNVNTNINNVENTLHEKIDDLDIRLTNSINGLISYGTAVPTTLDTGKIYLQYF